MTDQLPQDTAPRRPIEEIFLGAAAWYLDATSLVEETWGIEDSEQDLAWAVRQERAEAEILAARHFLFAIARRLAHETRPHPDKVPLMRHGLGDVSRAARDVAEGCMAVARYREDVDAARSEDDVRVSAAQDLLERVDARLCEAIERALGRFGDGERARLRAAVADPRLDL